MKLLNLPRVIQGVADLEAIEAVELATAEVAVVGFMAVHSPRSRWPRRSIRATSRASTSTRPAPGATRTSAGDATSVELALVTELLDLYRPGRGR